MNDQGMEGHLFFHHQLIGGNFQLEIPCGCYDLSRKHPERFSHHREPLESWQLTTHPQTPLPSQALADRLWLRKLPSASVPHAEGTSGISRFGWTDVFSFRWTARVVGLEERMAIHFYMFFFWLCHVKGSGKSFSLWPKQKLGKTHFRKCFPFFTMMEDHRNQISSLSGCKVNTKQSTRLEHTWGISPRGC